MTKAVALAAALMLLAAPACNDDAVGSRYASCIDLAAAGDRPIPDPLVLPEGAHVTELVEEEGFVVLHAVADGSVDDVYEPMEQELRRAGFDVVGRDYEGFEAELFLVSGEDSAGVARLRVGPCPEQVTLSILYDPLETKEGRAAVEEARRRAERRGATIPPPN